MHTTETIKISDDCYSLPEELIVDAVWERAKQGHQTPDDVIVNADSWREIAHRLGARIEHQHGGKTFEDRWLFLVTAAGTFRLFASPKLPRNEITIVGRS